MFSIFFSSYLFVVDAFFGTGRDKEKGPDPKINLLVHPQPNVIIPVDSFAWLHCWANSSIADVDYDYANDDPSAISDWQFPSEDDYQQSDGPNSVDTVISRNDYSGFACKQEVQYQWYHNGEPIDATDESTTETFCNGSIKIKYSTAAEGVYRCFAETTQSDVGAVVSKAATVKLAGMYYLSRDIETNKFLKITFFPSVFESDNGGKLSSRAELGSSIVLNCPITSIPKANIQWSFSNGTKIHFASSDR